MIRLPLRELSTRNSEPSTRILERVRETRHTDTSIEGIDGDRDEVQPFATKRVFDRQCVSGQRLSPNNVAHLESEALGPREPFPKRSDQRFTSDS